MIKLNFIFLQFTPYDLYLFYYLFFNYIPFNNLKYKNIENNHYILV